jgi:hypothetical protein
MRRMKTVIILGEREGERERRGGKEGKNITKHL